MAASCHPATAGWKEEKLALKLSLTDLESLDSFKDYHALMEQQIGNWNPKLLSLTILSTALLPKTSGISRKEHQTEEEYKQFLLARRADHQKIRRQKNKTNINECITIVKKIAGNNDISLNLDNDDNNIKRDSYLLNLVNQLQQTLMQTQPKITTNRDVDVSINFTSLKTVKEHIKSKKKEKAKQYRTIVNSNLIKITEKTKNIISQLPNNMKENIKEMIKNLKKTNKHLKKSKKSYELSLVNDETDRTLRYIEKNLLPKKIEKPRFFLRLLIEAHKENSKITIETNTPPCSRKNERERISRATEKSSIKEGQKIIKDVAKIYNLDLNIDEIKSHNGTEYLLTLIESLEQHLKNQNEQIKKKPPSYKNNQTYLFNETQNNSSQTLENLQTISSITNS